MRDLGRTCAAIAAGVSGFGHAEGAGGSLWSVGYEHPVHGGWRLYPFGGIIAFMTQRHEDEANGEHVAPTTHARQSASGKPPGPPRAKDYVVQVVADMDELAAFIEGWEDLARNALEPSPSCEWWMLIPSMRHQLPGRHVQVALIHETDGAASDKRVLCGVFPFEMERLHPRLPATVIRSWNHMYAVSAIPLVRRECANACVRAFFAWVRRSQSASALVHWPEVRVEGEFHSALQAVAEEDGLDTLTEKSWSRAVFRPGRVAQEGGRIDHRRLRRYAKRLSELGELVFDSVGPDERTDSWLEEFVELELRGWKGRMGTAFGSAAPHRAWLADIVGEGHRRGRVMLLALRLDGKPIAMKVNVLGPPGAYAFKITFDEAHIKYSPGVQLEIENIRRMQALPAIEWMDSLALPGNAMINRIWPERTAIVSILVAPGRLPGRILLALLPLLRLVGRLRRRKPPRESADPDESGSEQS